MALTDLFTAGRIPRELVGRTLVLGDAATLGSAESFLHALAERVGPIGLGNLGPESYQGPFDAVDLPAAHGADRKRLKKLKPARLIVLGEADQRFDLVSDADCDKLWLNAAAPEVTRCGCRVVTVSGEAQAAGVPGAQLTGDPLLGLDSLPALAADAELCDRFREYRERNHPVFYVAMAGEDEENSAYGMLFEILRKKTTIMLFSLADPRLLRRRRRGARTAVSLPRSRGARRHAQRQGDQRARYRHPPARRQAGAGRAAPRFGRGARRHPGRRGAGRRGRGCVGRSGDGPVRRPDEG